MSLLPILQKLTTIKPLVVAQLSSTRTPSKTVFQDDEFGEVICKRHHNAKYIRLRLSEEGQLTLTMPPRAPLSAARQLLESSRAELRGILEKQGVTAAPLYVHDMQIGHSHVIHVVDSASASPSVHLRGLVIEVTKPSGQSVESGSIQQLIEPLVHKALQKEARAYLPRRLQYLAENYGFSYKKVRFGTQKGRWGSCSSNDTISLNVGLMNLSIELIDYVLLHELCHTKQMNHSKQFWTLVENCLPDYRERRKLIKQQRPTH